MVKNNDQKKWVRPHATFKLSSVSKIETRPWKCPTCALRFKGKPYLVNHHKSHVSKAPSLEDIAPSARPGFVLPEKLSKSSSTISSGEALANGRKKGQKAKRRVRDVDEMKLLGELEWELILMVK